MHEISLGKRVWKMAAVALMASAAGGWHASVLADQPDGLPVAEVQRDTAVNFETEILPLLKRNCLACHNRSEAESDVVLESLADMLAAETDPPLIDRGHGIRSQLFLVASHRAESPMPPEDNDVGAQNLTPAQLGLLRLWIDQGARAAGSSSSGPVRWQPIAERLTPIYATSVSPAGDFVAAGRANRLY